MRCFFRYIIRLFIFILVALFVFFVFLPTLVSTDFGTNNFLKVINSFIPGKIEIKKISISWLGTQSIERFAYLDKEGKTICSLDKLETNTPLVYLLFVRKNCGDILIERPNLLISQRKKGHFNQSFGTIPLCFQNAINIKNGSLTFLSNKTSYIIFDNINIIKQTDPVLYHISALSYYGNETGAILVDVSNSGSLKISGKISNFPTVVINQLFDSNIFSNIIGDKINGNVLVTKDSEQKLVFDGNLDAKNLSGSIKGKVIDDQIIVDPSSQIILNINPKLINLWLPEYTREEFTMASPASIYINITQGRIPLFTESESGGGFELKAHGSLSKVELHHKTLQNYSLNNVFLDITVGENISLSYKGDVQGKEASAISGTLFINSDKEILFKTNINTFPLSLLQLLSPGCDKLIRSFIGSNFSADIDGKFKNNNLNVVTNINGTGVKIQTILQGASDNFSLHLIGDKTTPYKWANYVGETLSFDGKFYLKKSEDHWYINKINGKVFSPFFTSEVTGKIGSPGKPITINELDLIVKGDVTKIPFNADFPDIQLTSGKFFINAEGSSNKIIGQACINTLVKRESETKNSKIFHTQFEITDYIENDQIDFSKMAISFVSKFEDLPPAILNQFVPKPVDLKRLLGTSLNVEVQGNYKSGSDPLLALSISADGEGFSSAFSFSIDGQLHVYQNIPAFVHWEMTPERHHALVTMLWPEYNTLFRLTKPASVDLYIKELKCPSPLPSDVTDFLCRSGLVADLKVGMLSFQHKATKEPFVISEFGSHISGENFSKKIDLSFGGKIFAKSVPKQNRSAFSFSGTMSNILSDNKSFDINKVKIDGDLDLEFLPIKQITELFPMDSYSRDLIHAILGDLMNAKIHGQISQLSGSVIVDVKSSNFKAILPIELSPHAILLKDDIDIEIGLTEKVNQTLISDINPLFITGAYSEKPISMHLNHDGFVIPIRPYALDGIKCSGRVDIGKIRVRNGGQVQLLMNFLKAADITPDGEMDAWFTPIFMNLSDGVATYKRFDALLASNVHIAMWGGINLVTHKVKMTLGISPSTLQKHFNVHGLKDMFQIKMRGTTDKLELDWSSAYRRIGIIIAQTSGGLGYIIGSLLERLITTLGEEPTPPPTTVPFPWKE